MMHGIYLYLFGPLLSRMDLGEAYLQREGARIGPLPKPSNVWSHPSWLGEIPFLSIPPPIRMKKK